MRVFAHVLTTLAVWALAAMPAARAQDDPIVHVVTYIESMPALAKQNAGLLKLMADFSRKEAGVLRFEVLQRSGRPGHFAIVEAWKDQAALDAHAATAHSKVFRDKLEPSLTSPIDERLCNNITAGATPASGSARGVFVMTHVDIAGPNPQNRDAFIPVLKAVGEASRKATGNTRYDVLQQKSRTNHFQVVEVWKDQKADDAHEISATNKAYRAKLGAMQGALYDQRWYSAL
jgi:quinol monooxygenase YgiN